MLTSCVDKENVKSGIRAMGLSPGTVATQMQREIKASGINPVSQLDWSDHIPADWPARALFGCVQLMQITGLVRRYLCEMRLFVSKLA